MESQAIDKIVGLSKPDYKTFEGVPGHYTSKPMHQVLPEKRNPCALEINTLRGVVDYIKNNLDGESKRTIVINSPYQVSLYGEYDAITNKRPLYLKSIFNFNGYASESWDDAEGFIISVMSKFVKDGNRETLLKTVSGITSNSKVETNDDGVSQNVTVQSGISRMKEVEIQNPITLKPFKTFPDIQQPEILYNLRISKTKTPNYNSNGPGVSLFHCDGGLWKIKTIQAIKEFFEYELSSLGICKDSYSIIS